ncbi:hypothetical protein E2C01_093289 [Portunus trituberculatus]|uniref:Uncharacterized protein n=1 Tax=Portunus trituberculatus TaxID=210409 RepID=A0A5B7JU29_PORTR|nr:hypothetical protein [Portunus trituberculatus]
MLRETLVEGNPPSHSDLKMTSRGPDSNTKNGSKDKGNHLLGLQWEGALAAVDGVPRPHATQSFKKKAPHDTNVCPRQS